MPEIAFQPLLAADAWQTFFGVVVFILWSLGQWLNARQEQKAKRPEAKPQRPRPPQPQPVQREFDDLVKVGEPPRNAGPQNQEEALRNEVEDFLRRAQGKPERPKPASRPEPKVREQETRRRRKKTPKRVAPVERPSQRSEGVAEHVSRHLSTRDIVEHTESLGATVAGSDDRVESRLHEKFDHELGSLKHRETPVVAREGESEEDQNVAAEIAQMLRSPQGMRQLIVANEILRRPEW